MNARPTILPEVVAEFMNAAPGRVRKRLDRDPTTAKEWAWQKTGNQWSIQAGEETVTLAVGSDDQLSRVSDATCTCLLSPKCFHILACATTLTYGDSGDTINEAEPTADLRASGSKLVAASAVEVSESMRRAGRQMLDAIEKVLTTGARASGLVIQSTLLRAAHQCRAEGMINLANAAIRLAEGIQRLRAGDDHTDTQALRQDAVAAIRYARVVIGNEQLSAVDVGYARRPFDPVTLSRLRGILAEPILTLSGYAGVCVHLQGDDGRLYQVVDLRPGDVSLVGNAYRGGIDLGATTMSAKDLSRSRIDVQNLTAAPDGRLGKGTKTRWAVRTNAIDDNHNDRFKRPLADQIDEVFLNAPTGDDTKSGWDLVACEGSVLGPRGSTVLLRVEGVADPIQLGIAIDSERLEFRRNLQLIARCPDLAVRVYGRVRLEAAGVIDAMSVEPLDTDGPKLLLPDSFLGRCHLGLDQLQRNNFSSAERFATEVTADGELLREESVSSAQNSACSLFPGLDSRLAALVSGGRSSIAPISSATHRRDHERLMRRTQSSGAQLLDAIAIVTSASLAGSYESPIPHRIATTLAAADQYCVSARADHQRDRWRKLVLAAE